MDHQPDLELDSVELETITASPLTVFIDVQNLLEYFEGDEARTFDFLGKLKDFFE